MEVRRLDAQRVEQPDHVLGPDIEGVLLVGLVARPVAPRVVVDDPEMLGHPGGDGGIPLVTGDGTGHLEEPRTLTVDLVVQVHPVHVGMGHVRLLPPTDGHP